MTASQNNRFGGMIGGLLFCGFAVLAFHADHEIPLQWKGVLALFFVWGVWMFIAGLFNIDYGRHHRPDSAPPGHGR
jgi:hypothetical protein